MQTTPRLPDQDVILVAPQSAAASAAPPVAQIVPQILGPIQELLGQIHEIAQGRGPYAEADEPTIVEKTSA